MKRDWLIIKDIMSAIEENKVRTHWEALPEDKHNIYLLHYELLQESELVANYQMISDTDDFGNVSQHPVYWAQTPGICAIHLTMKGYDLLEVLRDQNLWSRIINKAKSLGIKLTFEFIKQAIPVIYKQLL